MLLLNVTGNSNYKLVLLTFTGNFKILFNLLLETVAVKRYSKLLNVTGNLIGDCSLKLLLEIFF
jgi:hypothetical protein